MSYERYVFIRSYLRMTKFVDNDSQTFNNVSDKTSLIVKMIKKMFKAVYVPGKEIYIDEMTIPFK